MIALARIRLTELFPWMKIRRRIRLTAPAWRSTLIL